MFRAALFEEVGGYRAECVGWEDQDLFLRLADRGRVMILPEVLYHYRYHTSNSTGSLPLEHLVSTIGGRNNYLTQFRQNGDRAKARPPDVHKRNRGTAAADALYQIGSMRLWAGRPPRILRDVIRTESFGVSVRALRTILFAIWGSVNAASLRTCLRAFIRARDFIASQRLANASYYDWRLPRQPSRKTLAATRPFT